MEQRTMNYNRLPVRHLLFIQALLTALLLALPTLASAAISGVQTIGQPVLPNGNMSFAGSIPLDDEYATASAIDPARKFLYFGTGEQLAKLVKMDISGTTPVRVAQLQLAPGETSPKAALIDSSGTYVYFAVAGSKARIVKVRTSDFVRVAHLDLAAADGLINCGAIDSTAAFAYFGTNTTPGKIVKVNLSTFSRVGALTLTADEYTVGCLAIDSSATSLYAGTTNFPARIIKVNLSNFTRNAAIVLPAGEFNMSVALIDPANTFAYFGCQTTGRVIKIQLSNFTRVTSIVSGANVSIDSGVMDPTGFYAYFGAGPTDTSLKTKVEKIDLNSFAAAGELQIGTQGSNVFCASILGNGAQAYFFTRSVVPSGSFGTRAYGSLHQIQLSTFTVANSQDFALAVNYASNMVVEPSGRHGYIINRIGNDPVILTEIDLLTQTRTRNFVVANDGSIGKSVLMDPLGRYIVALTESAQSITLYRFDLPTLYFNSLHGFSPNFFGAVQSAVIDPQGLFVYVSFYKSNPAKAQVVGADMFSDNDRYATFPVADQTTTAVMDPLGNYAYFGTFDDPARIHRLHLSDMKFQTLQLPAGDHYLLASSISSDGRYAYFGNIEENNPRVLKIDLNTFTRASALDLGTDASSLNSSVIDLYNVWAYFLGSNRISRVDLAGFALNQYLPIQGNESLVDDRQNQNLLTVAAGVPSSINRISLNSRGTIRATKLSLPQAGNLQSVSLYSHASADLQRRGHAQLNGNSVSSRASVIDMTRNLAYVGMDATPGRIARVDLGTMQQTGELTLQAGEDNLSCAVMDPARQFAYFGCFTTPGKIVKIDLSNFTEVATLTLTGPGEANLGCAVMDPAGQYAYFGISNDPGIVVKVRLSDFSEVSPSLFLQSGEGPLRAAAIAPDGKAAYFGALTSPGIVAKVNLSTFTRTGAVTLGVGQDQLQCAAIDPTGTYVFFGTSTVPGQVVRVQLSNLSNAGTVILNAGENDVTALSMDPNGAFAVAALGSGGVAKIDLPSFTRRAGINLLAADGSPAASIIDGQGQFTYLACSASPYSRLVRVDASPLPLRLGLYKDGTPKTLVWQSNRVAVKQANAFIAIPVASGNPTSVSLPAGNYYLAWQLDADIPAASYLAGSVGDGLILPWAFGKFPSTLTGQYPTAFATTADKWTGYITYSSQAAARAWMTYR